MKRSNRVAVDLEDLLREGRFKSWSKTVCPVEGSVRWIILTNDDETLHYKTNEAQALVKGATLIPRQV